MKRVKDGDIKFLLDDKIININNFSMKFYTVSPKNYNIEKTNEDVVTETSGDCTFYYICLEWVSLKRIGEGVLNYFCINNIHDEAFKDDYYNESVERTTHYYIDSNVIVPDDEDEPLQSWVETLNEDEFEGNNFGCSRLVKSVTIPDFVTKIDEYGFYNSKISEINLPSGLTNIGISAFYNCDNLQSITIPDSVTSLGTNCFNSCDSLTSVTIGASITSLPNYCFANCSGLKSIEIPNTVTALTASAFSGCTSLSSVTIGNGVKTIAANCFKNCSSLTDITFPDSINKTSSSIGTGCCQNCSSLTSVTFYDGITTIPSSMFDHCTSLQSITIPQTVTAISANAFSYCESLTSVTFPTMSTLKTGQDAFRNSGLLSVEIPDNVTVLGSGMFQECNNLTSVTIGSGVTTIPVYVVGWCYALRSLTMTRTTPPSLNSGALQGTSPELVIYVPEASLNAYKTASGWKTYASQIQPIPSN